MAVFAAVAGFDGSSEFDVEELHSITDTEDGNVVGFESLEIDVRGVGFAGALGAARENDRAGGADVVEVFGFVELGKVAKFTNAADNELGVLGAEIENGDVVSIGHAEKRKELRSFGVASFLFFEHEFHELIEFLRDHRRHEIHGNF